MGGSLLGGSMTNPVTPTLDGSQNLEPSPCHLGDNDTGLETPNSGVFFLLLIQRSGVLVFFFFSTFNLFLDSLLFLHSGEG